MTTPAMAPSSPAWLMAEDRFEPNRAAHFETIFTLANGYTGVRGSLETSPLLGDPGTYVAGVFDRTEGFVHEIVNLPCWVGVTADVDGFDLDLTRGRVLEYRRTLDMKQGILFTRITWEDGAKRTTRWESARLVHRTRKRAALIWGSVTALDYSGRLTLRSSIDAWAVKYASLSGKNHFRDVHACDLGEAGIAMVVTTRDPGIQVAQATRLTVAAAKSRSVRIDDDRAAESLVCRLEKNRPVAFEKRAVCWTSRDADDPARAAREELAAVSQVPVKRLVREHTGAWAKVWDAADIRIDGDPRAQKAIRFNVFHLASLANEHDDKVSIGAKGLHGNGYRGLVFWDTEIYLVPFFTYTDPPAARALLQYRFHMLPDCRTNARELGYTGARFPWNSSITARETPWKGWQEHVGSDTAYAVDQYVQATGDTDFYLRFGAQLIVETAAYWPSRVEFDRNRQQYVIRKLMGPDENHGGIDNNAYTNHLVKWHMGRALQAVADLTEAGRWRTLRKKLKITDEDLAKWADIRDRIYFPFDERKGFHEQFEGFFKLKERKIDHTKTQREYTGPVLHSYRPTQVSKQADTVLMYYLFPDEFPDAARKRGYAYYERRSLHCSSLSRSIYAAVAAQIGRTGEARRLFLRGAELDYGLYAECDSGIHSASLGGAWQAAVMGFGGFGVRGGRPRFDPHLPKEWRKLSYTVQWRKRILEVTVTRRSLRLRARSGSVSVDVRGEVRKIGTRAMTLPI